MGATEREEISRGVIAGRSMRSIAASLGRLVLRRSVESAAKRKSVKSDWMPESGYIRDTVRYSDGITKGASPQLGVGSAQGVAALTHSA
jgi:hypothetical protein